jgi:diguanylate cyclase (GGDEF)-like protein
MKHGATQGTALPEILLVDDDPGAIALLRSMLCGLARLKFATNGRDALRLAQESPPDLILLDAQMPGMSGFELMQALKSDAHLAELPVIFVTGHAEPAFEVIALDMGAADFIAKPFRSSQVTARVKTHLRLKRMSDELRHLASTDALTGIANRRVFDDALAHEWLRARRSGDPLSLLLIDVDHFKRYNDRYGHQMGDDCLIRVAQALRASCRRPADLVARYGGEEFMVLLPQTPRLGAECVAAGAIEAIQALGIAHEDSPTSRCVSVSIGAAAHDEDSPCVDAHGRCSAHDLVLAADEALYAAKRAGRAQVKVKDISEAFTWKHELDAEPCAAVRKPAVNF